MKYSARSLLVLLFICLLVPFCSVAQTRDSAELKDLWGIIFGEKKEDSTRKSRKERKIEFGGLPYIAVSPSAGIKFGAVTNMHYTLGKDSITRKSAGTISLAYTTKKQLFFYFRDLTFFPKNHWAADFDIRYNNNSENTYGLGSATPKDAKELLNFNTIRANVSLMYRFFENFYAGGGINYNRYHNIRGYQNDMSDPYYNYNIAHNIDLTKSVAAGFNISALFDNRDNIINAYKGVNARLSYSNLMKILGSEQAWQQLWAEFRGFQSLTTSNRHRLAFWSYASVILDGAVPYMNLPAVGYDLMGKSSRSYTIGRFRGDKILYAECEYRVSITNNDLIGAVVFTNASTVSAPDNSVKLFDHIDPAAGVGLRIKLNKFSRTNISIDYAIGKNSSGFYLDISETF